MIRIYVPQPLAVAHDVPLSGDAVHHVRTVLRQNIGDTLVLFNGDGLNYTATITDMTSRQITVRIGSATECNTQSPLVTHLFQGVCRGEKMDWVIQKATELGINHITPVYTQFGNVHLQHEREQKKIAHWQKVADSACEQSGRAHCVTLHDACSFNDALTVTQGMAIILDPTAAALPLATTAPDAVSLFVGPEGGFSDTEVALAIEQGLLRWRLGPRILRTETAGLVALTLLQNQWGDFSNPSPSNA